MDQVELADVPRDCRYASMPENFVRRTAPEAEEDGSFLDTVMNHEHTPSLAQLHLR